jgi:hypothetical protein
MVEKIIISPQIVVYKNILKNNKSIIDMMDSSSLVAWDTWYDQGWRSFINFEISNEKNNKNFNDINEICKAFDYIQDDYIKQYHGENGIWPNFLTNWDNVNLGQNEYKIDFFKYNHLSFKGIDWEKDLLMNYHVDEFFVDGVVKKEKKIVTVNFYLNDDYEGGEICSYNQDLNVSYRYKPVAGDAVVMPSSSPFFHAVKPFYSKDRYFLRLFITYNDDLVDSSNNNPYYFSNKHYLTNENESKFIDSGNQFFNVSVKEIEVGKDI